MSIAYMLKPYMQDAIYTGRYTKSFSTWSSQLYIMCLTGMWVPYFRDKITKMKNVLPKNTRKPEMFLVKITRKPKMLLGFTNKNALCQVLQICIEFL